jgi:hypothetical protein
VKFEPYYKIIYSSIEDKSYGIRLSVQWCRLLMPYVSKEEIAS